MAAKKTAKKTSSTKNLGELESNWLKTRDILVHEYEKAAVKSKKDAEIQRRKVKALRKKKKTLSNKVQTAKKRFTKNGDQATKKELNTVTKEANSIGEELKKASMLLAELSEAQKSLVTGAKRFTALNKALLKAETELNKPKKKKRRVKAKKVA